VIDGHAMIRDGVGKVEAAFQSSRKASSWRLSARGALVTAAGQVAATPRLQDGFALVEVASDAPVTLYQEGRTVSARAGQGRAVFLTGLQPYAPNRVGVEVDDLPFSALLDKAEKMVVPGYWQAARVRFGQAARPLTVALADVHGQPLSLGCRSWWVRGIACEARLPGLPVPSPSGVIGPLTCRPQYAGRGGTMRLACSALLAALAFIALAWATPASACTLCSCSATASAISFGTYNPASNSPLDASGTVAVNCSGIVSLFGWVEVRAGAGHSGTALQRTMTRSGSSLRYNLFTNSARTQVFGDGSGGTFVEPRR